MKKLTAMILALLMTLSLASCSNAGSPGNSKAPENNPPANSDSAGDSTGYKKFDGKIVLWTLAKDLQQFADRYKEETGNEVEVVVFDSADFKTKIMQTLGAKSKDVDVFVGEPQMLPDYYEAGFCADLSALDSQVKGRLVDYTYEAGCDSDGVLRAISYQACPGSVIYRRDLAQEVFGTDDPDEIGKLFASFDKIEETAATLQSKGYTIFGDTGALGQERRDHRGSGPSGLLRLRREHLPEQAGGQRHRVVRSLVCLHGRPPARTGRRRRCVGHG